MTPEQFADRMKHILEKYTNVNLRQEAVISLMADALDSLGYTKGLEIYFMNKLKEK